MASVSHMSYTCHMESESPCYACGTPASVQPVPKQSRPAKVAKSVRIRPWLLAKVETVCEEEDLTFNDAVERALEDWVNRRDQ